MRYEDAKAHIDALVDGAVMEYAMVRDEYFVSSQRLHALKNGIVMPGPPRFVVKDGLVPIRVDPDMPPGEIKVYPGASAPSWHTPPPLPIDLKDALKDAYTNDELERQIVRDYERNGVYSYPPAEMNGLRSIVNAPEEETMYGNDKCEQSQYGMKATFVHYDEADAPTPEPYAKTLKRLRKEIRDVEKQHKRNKKARKEVKRLQKQADAERAQRERDRELALRVLRNTAQIAPNFADRVHAAQKLMEWR
jgi:hypothetical protein